MQDVPNAEERSAVVVVGRVGSEGDPKGAYGLDLFRLQVAQVLFYLVQVGGVGEKLPGIDEVLIDVVKVGKEHLAPVDEVVESLLRGAAADVDVVEEEEHLQMVSGLQRTELFKEGVDGEYGGRKEGAAGGVREVFAEKESCTSVGEDESHTLHIGTIGRVEAFGYLLKKGGHGKTKYE